MSDAISEQYPGEGEILTRAASQYESSNPDFSIVPDRTALLVIDLQEHSAPTLLFSFCICTI